MSSCAGDSGGIVSVVSGEGLSCCCCGGGGGFGGHGCASECCWCVVQSRRRDAFFAFCSERGGLEQEVCGERVAEER